MSRISRTTTDALFNAHDASIRKRSSSNTTNKAMAIHRLIAIGTFGPDEIKAMTAAYEGALIDLGFADREDPLTELIAKSIVNVTATGERNPERIKERALNALG
ncbi:MAG: hypothetical protein WA866_15830, partial [Pseudolabrys sp.]